MTKEVLRNLQTTLLEAVLLNRPLPGTDHPVAFPDRSFVLSQPTVILLDENVADSISVKNSPKPIEILPMPVIRQRANAGEDITYLHFQPAEKDNDTVWLTLKAEIAPRDSNRSPLGLSGLRAGFHKVKPGQWEAVSEPTSFAM